MCSIRFKPMRAVERGVVGGVLVLQRVTHSSSTSAYQARPTLSELADVTLNRFFIVSIA